MKKIMLALGVIVLLSGCASIRTPVPDNVYEPPVLWNNLEV